MNPFAITCGLRRLALLLSLLLTLPLAAMAAEQRSFATPEAGVDALIEALKSNDAAALIAIVGDSYKNLVVTGDAARDAAMRADASAQLATFHALAEQGDAHRVLLMGEQAWPMPIPLVREGGAWRFATELGVDEIQNRRIGANERNAIDVLYAYLDAQREYAGRDRNGDGVLQYARRLASTPGRFDGLYWPADADKGEELSPFGPLVAEAGPYLSGHTPADPYRGYRFRILTRQGPHAAGGAYSYLINGRMVAGFALLAYPAEYGESGVMSFIVNQNGKVFEKDLGPGTARNAAAISAFDPGAGWKPLTP